VKFTFKTHCIRALSGYSPSPIKVIGFAQIQGRNFGLKSSGTNSEGEQDTVESGLRLRGLGEHYKLSQCGS